MTLLVLVTYCCETRCSSLSSFTQNKMVLSKLHSVTFLQKSSFKLTRSKNVLKVGSEKFSHLTQI